MNSKAKCCSISLVIFAITNIILALLLLVAFPLGIYPALLRSQIPIKTDDDGQFTKSGYYWSNPPAETDYYFYLFHILNPDNVTFLGHTPIVQEKGPYRWKEQDKKVSINFIANKSKVSYETTKTYVFSKEGSCPECEYDDFIELPNLSIATMARQLFENAGKLTKNQFLLADLFTLLLGIYPFSRVKMSEVLYVGYTDALLDFLQSPLKKDLDKQIGNPLGFDPPNIPLLGFFGGYNETSDGEYQAYTGQKGVEKVGMIQSWRGLTRLPFWNTNETANLIDTTDGALSGSFLKKKTSLRLFQSFLCRHLILNYDGEEKIEGIDSYRFTFDKNNLNPHAPSFEGYMFDNDEEVNYFPDWNSTLYGFPPGLVQQKCLPGKLETLPFVALASNPHFFDAPPEIQQTILGLSPNAEKHSMGEFNIQPKVGSALRANVRSQLNIALHINPNLTSLSHSASALFPSFWLHTSVKLKPYAYKFIKKSTMTIPKIAMWTGIGLAVASVISIILLILLIVMQRRKQDSAKL